MEEQLEVIFGVPVQALIVLSFLYCKTQEKVTEPQPSELKDHQVVEKPAVPKPVAKKRPAPCSVARSRLFKLPSKIRRKNFEYAVYSDDKGTCRVTIAYGIPEPPLLFTCEAILHEAIRTFYGVNKFTPVVESFHPGALILIARKNKSIKASGVVVNKDPILGFAGFTFWTNLSPQQWLNLRMWLQYYHAGEIRRYNFSKVYSRFGPSYTRALFVENLFKIVVAMRKRPWAEVGGIIDSLYQGLVAEA
jgi:hypothetical protein